jgi:hypothetical protein
MGSHCGIAVGGGMASLRKLPNTFPFCGLCGCRHDSGFCLYQNRIEIHHAAKRRVTLGRERGGLERPPSTQNETPMSNTINSGTVLIEENAFTAEFLRFQSEPWTRFYIAGEIIRESRKASGKQSPYASKGNSEAHVVEEEECRSVG